MTHDGDDAALSTLARRAATGDRAAFASLLDHLTPSWYRVAHTLTDNPAIAEELVQDAAVRVFFALPRWRADASVRTWTHQIVVNLCRDAGRRARRAHRLVPLDTPEVMTVMSSNDTPSDERDPVLHDTLRRAVAGLPHELAAVVSLRYDAELGFAEIAATLGIPVGTVSTRLRRALARLATQLPPTLRER